MKKPQIRSTTVIAVKKDGKVAMAGDGQVTMGNTVMKGNARKVRRMYDGKVLTGFAGATADAAYEPVEVDACKAHILDIFSVSPADEVVICIVVSREVERSV